MRTPLDFRPVKAAFYWQAGLALVAMIVGGLWAGVHGAVSAAIGGGISVLANAGYTWVMRRGSRPQTAKAALIALLRAEAVKLTLVLALLFLTLTFYKGIQIVVFFVTFFITVLAFSAAFLQQGAGKTKQNE
jgi:ATP synthase protein I